MFSYARPNSALLTTPSTRCAAHAARQNAGVRLPMLRILATVLGVLLASSALAAMHETRSVHFSYPDSYRPSMEGNTLLFAGPSGEGLRVSIIVVPPGKEDARPLDCTLGDMKPHLERFGTRSGLVFVRPITERQHVTGAPMYTAASYSQSRSYYLLQYVTAKPHALVYFTFEGSGDLDVATKTADEIVNSLEWK